MKKFTFFFAYVLLIFLFSCVGSKTNLERGNYDDAIDQSIKRIQRKHEQADVIILEEAYRKANEKDINQIIFLKREGRPGNWDDVYRYYKRISNRQEKIKPLLPLYIPGKTEQVFQVINYDDEMIAAKQKAAEYHYVVGKQLLEKGDRYNARIAFSEFIRVKDYYIMFKDIEEQIRKAHVQGITHVLFKMQTKTGSPMPPAFEEELTRISLSELDGEWIAYHTKEITGLNYDYYILVNMKMIHISPEEQKRLQYVETREIADGFQYVLDSKGNVKKDSLGNDIKLPKTKVISCTVIEHMQGKKAMIGGSLDYINTTSQQLIRTVPITAESVFDYRSAMAMGDLNALKPETRKKIGSAPVPYPSNAEMLLQTGTILKGMVKDIIWKNKEILN